MKKHILYLLVTIGVLSSMISGCGDKEYVLKKTTFTEAEESYKEEIVYDEHGNSVKSTLYDADGTVSLSSEMKYEYDKYGNYTKCSYTSDSKSYVEEYIYEYDTDGNILSCMGSRDGQSKGAYEYANGRLVKFTAYDSEGNVSDIKEYEYDENGKLLKETASMALSNSKSIHEYTYDEYGNEKNCSLTTQMGAMKYTVLTEYENEYDKDGNLIKQLQYDIVDGEKEFIGTMEFEYK